MMAYAADAAGGRATGPDGGPGPSAESLLAIAAGAAAEAAQLLAARGPDDRPEVVETKSSPTDVVTEMDRRSEALIADRIHAARPGDTILGEESGETGGQAGPAAGGAGPAVRWIVDPLDGTVNYLYGLWDWSVSIAAEVAGTIMAGVVAAPRRGETFMAVRGQGAWLHRASWLAHGAMSGAGLADGGPSGGGRPDGDDQDEEWPDRPGTPAGPAGPAGSGDDLLRSGAVALACTRDVPLAQALVGTGFGYASGRRRVQGAVVGALLPQIRDIRRGGSASVDLCMVAAGRLDAFYERGLNYWDHAAGGLIAHEAGAQVTGLLGRPAGPGMTVAAGPGLYEELTAVLTGLNPERDA